MTNKHINIVVLGNFNPSILTHQFLVTKCKFGLGNSPTQQNPPIPVVSSVEYGNIHFFADLGRLCITEKNCIEPKQSKLPEYIDTYLKTLPYTPITKCGANFSYKAEIELARLDKIKTILAGDRKDLCKSLQIDNLQLQVFFDISSEIEDVEKWIIRTSPQGQEVKTILTISCKSGSNTLGIDFNYEVTLTKDLKLIKNIIDGYAEVYDLFLAQIQGLFEKEIL